MKITRSDRILLFLVIILLGIVKPSHQTVYSCNASVSCGCSTNSATLTRIVGGENAAAGTWGWAVSISIANTYLCGGSIISSSWVLTAAHCVNGNSASQITIYAGSIYRFSGTSIVASQVIVHSGYDSSTYVNDIALLQLSSPLNMNNPDVSMICLPSVSAATLAAGEWPAAGTTVVAVGWGTLSSGGSLPTSLQQVTLQTVSYQASTCASIISNWTYQLCAGASGKDTCQGDSGGPLMMFSSSNQWVLVGLTSYGDGCANPQYSGVYTRVAAYESWISSYTNGSVSISTSSVSTTSSSSILTITSATAFTIIYSHVNTVRTSIFNIFVFVLFNLLLEFFY